MFISFNLARGFISSDQWNLVTAHRFHRLIYSVRVFLFQQKKNSSCLRFLFFRIGLHFIHSLKNDLVCEVYCVEFLKDVLYACIVKAMHFPRLSPLTRSESVFLTAKPMCGKLYTLFFHCLSAELFEKDILSLSRVNKPHCIKIPAPSAARRPERRRHYRELGAVGRDQRWHICSSKEKQHIHTCVYVHPFLDNSWVSWSCINTQAHFSQQI